MNLPVQALSVKVRFNRFAGKMHIYMEHSEDLFVMSVFSFANRTLELQSSSFQTQVVKSLASFTYLGTLTVFAGLDSSDIS